MVPNSDPAHPRLRFLDAARGVTMVFVFVSHFAWLYVGTPTLVILSGMVLGMQYHRFAPRPRLASVPVMWMEGAY
jgi:hypothetical protein